MRFFQGKTPLTKKIVIQQKTCMKKTNTSPNAHSKNYCMRLVTLLKAAILVALCIAVSTITPIFAWTTGQALAFLGNWYGDTDSTPQAYVILGGGLTKDSQNQITLNTYSLLRTQTVSHALYHTQNPLPIITSGVESPWIVDVLHKNAQKTNHTLPIIISENASMNTCENAWFSAKLMDFEHKNRTIPTINHVYLVSDWYHMARARRQFAKAGIFTTPLVAPMPNPLSWTNWRNNLEHSRRAFYESVALARDIIRPQKNCRNPDTITIKTLQTPRRSPKTF